MTPRSAGRLGLEFLRGRGLKLVWVAQQMGISDRHLSNTLNERYKTPGTFWPRLQAAIHFTPAEQDALIAAGVAPEAFGRGPS